MNKKRGSFLIVHPLKFGLSIGGINRWNIGHICIYWVGTSRHVRGSFFPSVTPVLLLEDTQLGAVDKYGGIKLPKQNSTISLLLNTR